MQLHLKRSQRKDEGWTSEYLTYILEARLEPTPEEDAGLYMYPHRNELIYESSGYVFCQERAGACFQSAQDGIPETPKEPGLLDYAQLCVGITMGVVNTTVGVGFAVASVFCLQINLLTLSGDGHYIESQSLEEILEIENKLNTAVEYFSQYLKVAEYFDGSEDVREWS
jgi:hypothetical protein